MSDVNIRINLITKQAEQQLARFNREIQGADTNVDKLGKTGKKAATSLTKSFGRTTDIIKGIVGANLFFTFGRQIVNFVTGSVRAFAEFEQALVGVGKTTDLSADELDRFSDVIKNLAGEIPVAQTELLRIAQIAGQLGIRGSKNLEKFTDTIAKLVVATDLTAENAALALSRILNITGEPIENVDNLASAVVGLGNNFETLESELVTITNELARGTAGFGLASQELFALGTALKSLGVQAESGGTAIGIVFGKIDKAIANGGPQLQKFADLTGIAADKLQEEFGRNALGVFQKFIEGTAKSGRNLTTTLGELSLDQQRTLKTLRPLIENYQKLGEAVTASDKFYSENIELNREAERAFSTLSSEAIVLKNELVNLVVDGFGPLSPVIKTTLKAWSQTIKFFRTDSVSELKGNLKELNKEYIESEIKVFKLNKRLQEVTNSSASASVRALASQRIRKRLNKELGVNVELFQKLRKARDEFAERTGVDTGAELGPQLPEGFLAEQEAKEQRRKLETQSLFQELAKENLRQSLVEISEINRLNSEIEFQNLADRIGQEQALKITIDAEEKLRLAKNADERLKIIQSTNKKIADEEKKAADAQKKLDQVVSSKKVDILRSSFGLAAALAKDGSKEQFAIQKAAALAEIAIADGKARGLVPAQVAAIPFPASIPAAAQLNALITANTALATATVIASAVKGFQGGGVVGGNSFSGDNVLARVNSGEMILNRQQQSELFQQANGGGQSRPTEIVVNSTLEVEGETLAKSVSRQVADGFQLGENT